jgi:hypothetical protein
LPRDLNPLPRLGRILPRSIALRLDLKLANSRWAIQRQAKDNDGNPSLAHDPPDVALLPWDQIFLHPSSI